MSVYQRSDRIYFTPAQVVVFMNGYLLEDACAITYEAADKWMPLWGHNDRLLRTYAVGQTIVMGELVIQFRYHGYLKRVISAVQKSASNMAGDASQIPALRAGQSAKALSDDALQQDAGAVLSFLDAAGENSDESYARAAGFLKARFWGESGSAKDRDVTLTEINGKTGPESQEAENNRLSYQDYMRPSVAREQSLRLKVVHGPDANVGRRAFAEVLEMVQFTGKSYRADIRVPAGETICAEVYPFMAKELRPV